MGGGKNSGSGDASSAAANKLADISAQMFEEGSGVRGQIQDMASKVLSGEYSPRMLPAYAPLYAESKKGLESQYNVARNNIMSNTPAGGALYSALADLENKRASSIGSAGNTLTSSLVSDIINKGYGGAYNSAGSALSGLSGSANTLASLNNTEVASGNAIGQGFGQLIGTLGMAAALK